MAHKIINIRDAFRDVLLSKTDAGANIFVARVSQFLDDELPAVAIEIAGDEVVNGNDVYFQQYSGRQLEVDLMILVKLEDGAEDLVFKIAGQIEAEIYKNKYLNLGNSIISSIYYKGCMVTSSNFGETNVACAKMKYFVNYKAKNGDLL